MKTFKATGIVLFNKGFFETDKLVELFTPTHGKLKCLAKSAQKPTSKMGGKVDPLNIIECIFYKGKSFNILSQAHLKSNFNTIRTHFNTLQMALHFITIIRNRWCICL